MKDVHSFLADIKTKTGNSDIPLLSLKETVLQAAAFKLSVKELEILALQQGIVPARYQRNIGTIGIDGQLKLLQAKAVVIGAGGLGGYIIELLARAGIGHLAIADGDAFSDNNLNRQLFCREEDLGRNKALVAAERVKEVNQAVTVEWFPVFVDEQNIDEITAEAHVLVDALDNLPGRMMLQECATRRGLPLVHGAIAGFMGQVMTVFPGDPGLTAFYGPKDQLPQRGVETIKGNLTPTPAMIAAWQAQEVIKVITGIGQPLQGQMLILDAASGVCQTFAMVK